MTRRLPWLQDAPPKNERPRKTLATPNRRPKPPRVAIDEPGNEHVRPIRHLSDRPAVAQGMTDVLTKLFKKKLR